MQKDDIYYLISLPPPYIVARRGTASQHDIRYSDGAFVARLTIAFGQLPVDGWLEVWVTPRFQRGIRKMFRIPRSILVYKALLAEFGQGMVDASRVELAIDKGTRTLRVGLVIAEV